MPDKTPVVFIHGMWIHSSSWGEWIDLFARAGYAPVAPGWPGESDTVGMTRLLAAELAGSGLVDITDHYARIIQTLPRPPIVIGHSFGGLVAQKLLADGLVAAAVAIDPAPIKGTTKLPLNQILSVLPVLAKKSNETGVVSLTARQFKFAFGNKLTRAESRTLYRHWSIPAGGKPVFEVAAAKKDPESPTAVDTAMKGRGPLLITGGEFDHTIPEAVTREAFDLYPRKPAVTEYKRFLDRGHSLTIDSGWFEVADYSLRWLAKHALAPADTAR